MSYIAATDLTDALLSSYASKYLADACAWVEEEAARAGAASVLATLTGRAKRAAVYQLAILICLGEMGQNQSAFSGDGDDVFVVKLKAYQKQLDAILPSLSAEDWGGKTESTDSDDGPSRLCARLFRA